MKKLFLAVALVMGLGTSVAFANNMVSDVEIATMINEFKWLKMELRLTRLRWWMQPVQRIRSFSMKKGKFRNKLYTQ